MLFTWLSCGRGSGAGILIGRSITRLPVSDLHPSQSPLLYRYVKNGVYQAGFATTQKAYEEAAIALFETLDWLEQRLARQRYLLGDRLTEADWRLFTTLIRFDPVYVGHFKCNLRRLVDYPALWAYTRDLYQHVGVADTIDMHHIKHHYYVSHTTINPTGASGSRQVLRTMPLRCVSKVRNARSTWLKRL